MVVIYGLIYYEVRFFFVFVIVSLLFCIGSFMFLREYVVYVEVVLC